MQHREQIVMETCLMKVNKSYSHDVVKTCLLGCKTEIDGMIFNLSESV